MLKRILPFIASAVLFCNSASATHIVGGDITVKWLNGNNFEITLTHYFDCINGQPGAFDSTVAVGIFNKATNLIVDSLTIPFIDSLTLVLGDACYTPSNLCIRQQRYITTVSIPNNPSGYYLAWLRCCRNSIISNIISPGNSGNVFYTEIPDPALQNSTPTFNTYPDAYMCVNNPNIDDFSRSEERRVGKECRL